MMATICPIAALYQLPDGVLGTIGGILRCVHTCPGPFFSCETLASARAMHACIQSRDATDQHPSSGRAICIGFMLVCECHPRVYQCVCVTGSKARNWISAQGSGYIMYATGFKRCLVAFISLKI